MTLFSIPPRQRWGPFMTRFVTKTKIFGNMSTFNCLIVLFLAFYCNAGTFLRAHDIFYPALFSTVSFFMT